MLSNVLKTKDFSPLELKIVENKYYAQDIGEIKATSIKGEKDAEPLKEINTAGKYDTGMPTEHREFTSIMLQVLYNLPIAY
jgi:hypothetical protein